MDLDSLWAKPAARLAAWIALLYLAVVGGAVVLANVIAGASTWFGLVFFYGLLAFPLVLAVLVVVLLVAAGEWWWHRRKKPDAS